MTKKMSAIATVMLASAVGGRRSGSSACEIANGNELSARHYLACGYEHSDTKSMEERISERLWD